MDRYVTLVGAEDVSRAGARIAEAGSSMQGAASTMEQALERHASRAEDTLREGLPANQLELLGLVALLNHRTAILNADVAVLNSGAGCGPSLDPDPDAGLKARIQELIVKVRGA